MSTPVHVERVYGVAQFPKIAASIVWGGYDDDNPIPEPAVVMTVSGDCLINLQQEDRHVLLGYDQMMALAVEAFYFVGKEDLTVMAKALRAELKRRAGHESEPF